MCLPDYILWMEDLTPIMNFEPFAEILRKVNKSWLSEIMTSDYAVVEYDVPAIQVAKEVTRQRANRAYVVQGRNLLGIVSCLTAWGCIARLSPYMPKARQREQKVMRHQQNIQTEQKARCYFGDRLLLGHIKYQRPKLHRKMQK